MKIEISKRQNVRIDGVEYVAVANANVGCRRCAFGDIDGCRSIPCLPDMRKDNQHVIFVKKEQQK